MASADDRPQQAATAAAAPEDEAAATAEQQLQAECMASADNQLQQAAAAAVEDALTVTSDWHLQPQRVVSTRGTLQEAAATGSEVAAAIAGEERRTKQPTRKTAYSKSTIIIEKGAAEPGLQSASLPDVAAAAGMAPPAALAAASHAADLLATGAEVASAAGVMANLLPEEQMSEPQPPRRRLHGSTEATAPEWLRTGVPASMSSPEGARNGIVKVRQLWKPTRWRALMLLAFD